MKRLALTLGVMLMVGVIASDAVAQVAAARFAIVIDGTELASFTSVSALGSTSEVVEMTQPTPDGGSVTRRIPGKVRYRDVTVIRPATADTTLNAWREQIVAGNLAAARKDVAIIGFNAAGQAVIRFDLDDAWPSALEVYTDPETRVLTESLTLVAQTIQRSAP